MPTITIRDDLDGEVVSANPLATSGFGRYLKGTGATLLAGAEVAGQLRAPLALANAGESGLGLSFQTSVPLGHSKAALTIAAGARALVGVYNRTGMRLLETTFIGPTLTVRPGQAFVAFSLRPVLELGVKREAGGLSFGFEAGSEADLRCYRPFERGGDGLTVAAATREVLEHFVIPNSVDDLRALKDAPDGTLAVAAGHGRLQLSSTVNVAAAFNPLASVDTLPRIGPLTVGGGASAQVGLTATLSGEYQVRVQKIGDARLRLGLHTVAGRSLNVSVDAAAGASLTLGDRDLLALFFDGPGGQPGAATEDLVAAGITRGQLDRVAEVLRAGLSRRLELALHAELTTLRDDEAAVLCEIDLDGLDALGAAALDRALSGDLTALTALRDGAPAAHGIRLLQSRLETMRAKTISWRINVVGLVNVLSLSELVRTGSVVHDDESGEVTVVDKVTTERVGAITDRRQLRKLLYESAMMTLTYRASGLDVNSTLEAAQSFFVFDRTANRQRASDYLDAVAAVGLLPATDIERVLDGHDDFGRAGLSLEARFDQAACDRIFRQPGPPPNQHFYEVIGRQALAALVKASDPDAYRRLPMVDDRLWTAMKAAGQPNFGHILPPPITGGSDAGQALRVAVVVADYTTIVWWADAMATAAEQLAAMRAFLHGRSAATLTDDPAFRKKRTGLEKAVVRAIRKNQTVFDDPWGLVALTLAADGTAAVSAMILSPVLTLLLPEPA